MQCVVTQRARGVYVSDRCRSACWAEGDDGAGRHPQAARCPSDPCADLDGFSQHAAVRCGADDGRGLEQPCRFIARQALGNDGVHTGAAGRVVHRLQTPWRQGATHLVMPLFDFMQWLAVPANRPGAFMASSCL